MGSVAVNLRDRTRPAVPPSARRFDLFVAAPMAAFESRPKFEASQKAVMNTISDLVSSGTARLVYYAGRAVGAAQDFTPSHDALEEDLGALAASARLLLIYPAKLATGALVELGYAFALKLPAAILVRDFDDLPYFLRHVRGLHRLSAAGPIMVKQYRGNHELSSCARAALDELL